MANEDEKRDASSVDVHLHDPNVKEFLRAFDSGSQRAKLVDISRAYNKLPKQQQEAILFHQDEHGRDLVMSAVMQDNVVLLVWLLSIGADPDTEDAFGASPLGWAIYNKNVEMAHMLLSHPRAVSKYRTYQTLLNESKSVDNIDFAKEFQNKQGQTILHSAMHAQDPNLLRLILSMRHFDFLMETRDFKGNLPEKEVSSQACYRILMTCKGTVEREKRQAREQMLARRNAVNAAGNGADNNANDNLCVVCKREEKKYAFLPCGHKCVCQTHAKQIRDTTSVCPVCNVQAEGVVCVLE